MLADRGRYAARVVGRRPTADLAVVRVDAEGLRPATFADSADVAVGDIAERLAGACGTVPIGARTQHRGPLDAGGPRTQHHHHLLAEALAAGVHGAGEGADIDRSLPSEVLHERVERLAVPTFDWVA